VSPLQRLPTVTDRYPERLNVTVLKSTGSEFHGFPEVEYTSLDELDGILAKIGA